MDSSETPATIKPSREILSLTSVRGLAALWVVFYHYWNAATLLFPPLKVLSPIILDGHYAVPFFFILSGYILAFTYENKLTPLTRRIYVHFLLRRLARIYPVHLATLLIVLAMVLVGGRLGVEYARSG